MSGHKKIFQTLYGKNEGGLMKLSSRTVYTFRICQITPTNSRLRTETDWFQHLLSDSHQKIHRSHQLLRKVLWDLDRTVAITNVMGLRKGDILNYVIQLGCQVVDFSYLSVSDGKTAACYALLSSMWVMRNRIGNVAFVIRFSKFRVLDQSWIWYRTSSHRITFNRKSLQSVGLMTKRNASIWNGEEILLLRSKALDQKAGQFDFCVWIRKLCITFNTMLMNIKY